MDLLNSESVIPLVPRIYGSFLGGNWRPVASYPFSRHEHISVLEVRAFVSSLCILAQRRGAHGSRCLLLSDSEACILGASIGRSSKPGMYRALQQVAALVI